MLELEKKKKVYDATASERDKLYSQIFHGLSEGKLHSLALVHIAELSVHVSQRSRSRPP